MRGGTSSSARGPLCAKSTLCVRCVHGSPLWRSDSPYPPSSDYGAASVGSYNFLNRPWALLHRTNWESCLTQLRAEFRNVFINMSIRLATFVVLFVVAAGERCCAGAVVEADVCVYGATSGGVAAAVQAARMGKTAVLAEFGKHLGGLTSGGLGATDIGNKAAIGGMAREFYGRVARYYAADSAWKFET